MTGQPMVGRAVELASIGAAWARVRDMGASRVVVITGDDGVGKSRLVTEALSDLAPTTVLAGRARAVGPAPYDWLASALDGRPLNGLPGPPEALAWLTQHPSAYRYEPGALLRVAVDVVRHSLAGSPGVLVVEDLHDLDPASLNLVADLAAAPALPALLLVTSRPTGGSAARVLAQLTGAAQAIRCHLGPFTPTEVATFLAAGLGTPSAPNVVLRTHRRTGGNPRWLAELVASVRGGALASPTSRPLPPYIASLATARLDGTDERVARVAALLGGGLTLSALTDLCGDGTEYAVARLVAVGVLVHSGEPRFASPIVAESLVQTTPSSLRTDVNAAAHERAVAAGDLDGQVRHGVHHGLRPRLAVEATDAHLAAGRARAALDLVSTVDGTSSPALLRNGTTAAHAIGDYPRAAAYARRWRDATKDPADRVESMRVYADLCGHLGRAATQHRLLETIAPRVRPDGRASYLTSLAWAALCAERPTEAVGWAAQALEVASEPDAAALVVLGQATAVTGDTERGLTLLATGRRYAAARRDLVTFARAVNALTAVRLPGLSSEAVRRVLDEHLAALARHGLHGRAGPAVVAGVRAAIASQGFARARELADDRLTIETDPVERVVLTALAGCLAVQDGDRERALNLRERLEADAIGMDLPRVRSHTAALDLALTHNHAAEALTMLGFDTVEPPGAELTAREREVLACLAEGMTNQQVASRLGISIRTVTVHVSNLLRKTGSGSRTEAALWAVHHGLARAG